EVADRGLAESLLVVRRRADIATFNDFPISLSGISVADNAEDIEPLLAAIEHFLGDRLGELLSEGSGGASTGEQAEDLAEIDAGAGAAGEQEGVVAKLAAGNGARHRHAGRAAVAEEVAGLEGIVAGLIGHLLIAAARQRRTKQHRRN